MLRQLARCPRRSGSGEAGGPGDELSTEPVLILTKSVNLLRLRLDESPLYRSGFTSGSAIGSGLGSVGHKLSR